jgi:hypothetical protein
VFGTLGQTLRVATLGLVAGRIDLLAGATEDAEREFRASYELLEGMGERDAVATAAADLAEACFLLGRDEEAMKLTETSERAAAPQDVLSAISWRRTRARLLAQSGATPKAERLAREGVELAERTDFLNVQADALLALAEVLEAGEKAKSAGAAAAGALKLYELKGNVASAYAAREVVEMVST